MRWLAVIALVAGCGDPALCSRDVKVLLKTPLTVTADVDPVAPGVQTPINVDTTMGGGQRVSLDVMDDTGMIVATLMATTDVSGVASFGPVTVPAPLAQLRAAATDLCGADTATAKLDVLAGAHCDLALATAPVSIPRYDPLPVFNDATDVDTTTAGEQVDVTISTRIGWTVEVRERSPEHGDETMLTFAQPTLATTIPVTLRDGNTDVFAVCRRDVITLTSAAVFSFVDATPPSCTIPMDDPIVAIGPVDVIGRAADDDVEGEPATITVTPTDTGVPIDADASAMAGGTSHGTVTIGASQVDITFATHDHAQNACSVTKRFAVSH